ncbi:hypothetical protein NMY22_g17828 [Coprinellus aureogranulatus]|nr:hypothetical protein NMY22_g17828 [Coprinellus aureogranulatus]
MISPPLDARRKTKTSATIANGEMRQLFLHESQRSAFGVLRRYILPDAVELVHDPDQTQSTTDVVAHNPSAEAAQAPVSSALAPGDEPLPPKPYAPFASMTAFLLAEWYWNSTNKSFLDFRKLITIMSNPAFCLEDATGANWNVAFRELGANRDDLPEKEGLWIEDDGWKTDVVTIDIPFHKQTKDPGARSYAVGPFRHRSLVSVIKERICNRSQSHIFHYYPYHATWKRTNDSPEVELYGEMYTSRAFREAHEALQRQPSTPLNKGLERVVVALMFYSDSTQLTSFGGASLWPCYLFFGNDSKYARGKPSERLGNQVAYFLKLPDKIYDHLKDRNEGKLPTDALIKYCSRELFHRQWSILLDAEFLDAMKFGIVIPCPDGKSRCFYPRIFSYAADYPEKVLIGGVRTNGKCPCHRCFIPKAEIYRLGAPSDLHRTDNQRSTVEQQTMVNEAQKVIRAGYAVDTPAIEKAMKPKSIVPVKVSIVFATFERMPKLKHSILKSAFTTRIPTSDFDILSTLAVDLLHEFEIGVWKRLFAHLVRLLDAFTRRDTDSLSAELNARYRETPVFGSDKIRKFPMNASEMKRRAARDYEDLLQCAIPAFDSLLPASHGGRVMNLLFICAQWHALAKLRLHNDFTLNLLEYTMSQLGAEMRSFHHACAGIPTKETESEAEARAGKKATPGKGPEQRPVPLKIFTIKFHYLGDYVTTIRRLGTTDSYSTQTGELYHREPKSWYPRTDKKDYELQLAQIERRKSRLAQIRARNSAAPQATELAQAQESDAQPSSSSESVARPSMTSADLASASPPRDSFPDPDTDDLGLDFECAISSRFNIGLSENHPISLHTTTQSLAPGKGERDDYIPDFVPKLKRHLLPRILARIGCPPDALDGPDEWMHVAIRGNTIYSHKILHINFTTYDVRRDQDIIHINTPQCNVMLLNDKYDQQSHHVAHPYLYGRALGVFHANVSFAGRLPPGTKKPDPFRLDFVWIHWYDFLEACNPFSLDRVSLAPLDLDEGGHDALGFVDPALILRAVHLIPHFSLGEADGVHPQSKLVPEQVPWKAYYINRFADRDAFMRYQYGMSVGHTYMHTASFPEAKVPSIPAGFDYCLEPPREEDEDEDDDYEGQLDREDIDQQDQSNGMELASYTHTSGCDNEF